MLSRIATASLNGIDASLISVEVDISNGLPGWHMVGLPEQVVKESKDRVSAALRNSGFTLPTQKITVNFSPADHRKRGTGFDLPIAVGLLATSGFLPLPKVSKYLFVAELSLTGKLLPVNGLIAVAINAKKNKFEGLVVPEDNYQEARLVTGIDVVGCRDLKSVVSFIKEDLRPDARVQSVSKKVGKHEIDFADVKGQVVAKRAMEIAAAGGHNILMVGPPGSGKTMLAERLPTILPPLGEDESLETTKIYSSMGLLDVGSPLMKTRPFRAPHHSSSYAGLFGGGTGVPTIGEVSLSHNGVLFLDELPEFRRDVIEMLRQPLELGRVNITRAGYSVSFPAKFILSAAMNPCRCGYIGHPIKSCRCSMQQVQSYRQKLSGPLLDRIDLRIEVTALTSNELTEVKKPESSSEVRKRVVAARKIQEDRFSQIGVSCNAQLTSPMIKKFCDIDSKSETLLKKIIDSKGYSARSFDRIIRVARTIADLEVSKDIKLNHIAEAVQHHRLERFDEI